MAILFVSHSSKDDSIVAALETWLEANGFVDVFVDHQNIAGGDKWRDALRASAGACRVIICLVTEHWLASHECFGEFVAGCYMGKRIIPLFLLPAEAALGESCKSRLAKVRAEDQGIDIIGCSRPGGQFDLAADDSVSARLKEGLRAAGAVARVGLDPQAFAIDPKLRPTPFPGLASFGDDDADAALFYGRSREIAEALEELRKMRAERDIRPFVILGASGAGKSSLLKAGIIPRLRREAPAWLPLRAFRPGGDPLFNFAQALSRTLADFGKAEAHGPVRDRLFSVWSAAERNGGSLTPSGLAKLEAGLEAEMQALRIAAGRPAATVLVSVDQAEELVRAVGDSSEALADYLRVALAASTGSYQVVFTTRTDSFPEIQNHRLFEGLEARGYDLRAMPVFRFDSIVEEPARRYGVEVDAVLVDSLMEDAPKADALPLLAFALQRLWQQYASSRTLTKANYQKVGGLTGLIENAAERALRGIGPEQDAPLPATPLPKRLADLGASTFVPALAEINEQGATIRRVAEWTDFDEEQQEMLQRFALWRLVVRKGDAERGTIEVAHEALFREWSRLAGWLEPERERLEALRLIQIDAQIWDRNRRESGFLNHRGKRLLQANTLAQNHAYAKRLGATELDYLAACDKAERLLRRRALRVQALAGVLAIAIAVGLAAWRYQSVLKEGVYWFTHVRGRVLTALQERSIRPGQSFKECIDCPAMIVLPAGTFMMGSPPGQGLADEHPLHAVTIGQPIAVSKVEVTFAEWDACADHGNCNPRISANGWGRGGQPLLHVTWEDAQRYVSWLSKITGKQYRLLTEAEWEYAARGGANASTLYFFGNDETPLGKFGWYAANSNNRTHPVATLKPNPFGLYDFYGNVAEWVEDCYHAGYGQAPTDGSKAWTSGNCDQRRRVIRGGSWLGRARSLRSASRGWEYSDNESDEIGFRVARTLRQ